MKKLFALVLALMMVLGMAACAQSEQNPSGETKDTSTQGGGEAQASEVEV